jgi:hypothetical protein
LRTPYDELLAESPRDAKLRDAIVDVHMNLGIILMATRGMGTAEPSFRHATSMDEELAALRQGLALEPNKVATRPIGFSWTCGPLRDIISVWFRFVYQFDVGVFLSMLAGRLRSMNDHPSPTSCHDPGFRTGGNVSWAIRYRAKSMRIGQTKH